METPKFLLREMSPALRAALEDEAHSNDIPLQEVIRSTLCEHYALDCTPIEGYKRDDAWKETTTVLVSMQPELFDAIKRDSEESGESMRTLILSALESNVEVPT